MNIGEITCGNFLLHNYFRITGRGLAVAGKITSGYIAAGNFISVCKELVKIKSIEFVRVPGGELTGLMLDIAESSGIETQLGKLKGQTLSIITDSAS
jgi:hypothetical protein